jgi:hypothetical protein
MKNISLFLFFSCLVFSATLAQSYKGNYTFQKNLYPAAAIQVASDDDVVTNAIKEYMSKKGYKETKYKDFLVYRSLPLNENPSSAIDAYFNINQKSHSEKDITIVSLLPVKKGETLTPTAIDSSSMDLAVTYLDSMRYNILSYSLKQQIATQQKAVNKINSKLVDLKNDSGDIAKKIRSYENDLQQNKVDQDKQKTVISQTSTGDAAGLAKANKKMSKLMDDQADYEKKIRNYKSDLDKNTQDRATQQSLYETANTQLESIKKRLVDLK